MLDERHDVAAGRQRNQPLRESHEHIINLIGLGLRLGLGDAADGENPLFPLVLEEDSVAAVPVLERCHVARLSANATPMRRGKSYQFGSSDFRVGEK
ncbi:MAG: hypothetical protein ACLP9L_10975 [Thermoguttaceae bacterium]